MLKIVIKRQERFDEETNKFFYYPKEDTVLTLEHSLLSISKWEEKHHKPFLDNKELTTEELFDYIKCMCVKPSPEQLDNKLLLSLSNENVNDIYSYIKDPMTATFFSDTGKKKNKNKKIITNELIYYWMVSYQIPFSCEKWHINKLLTLIQVCNAENEAANKSANKKNGKGERMSTSEIAARKALNAQRRAKLHSKG